jgi:hypothetical protein
MVKDYWTNLPAVGAYLSIILLTCLTTAMIALFCSVWFRTTSMSLITTYMVIIVLFAAPLAIEAFSDRFFRPKTTSANGAPALEESEITGVDWLGVVSPFSAAKAIPLDIALGTDTPNQSQLAGNWPLYGLYVATTLGLNALLLIVMIWLFRTRWRVAM